MFIDPESCPCHRLQHMPGGPVGIPFSMNTFLMLPLCIPVSRSCPLGLHRKESKERMARQLPGPGHMASVGASLRPLPHHRKQMIPRFKMEEEIGVKGYPGSRGTDGIYLSTTSRVWECCLERAGQTELGWISGVCHGESKSKSK